MNFMEKITFGSVELVFTNEKKKKTAEMLLKKYVYRNEFNNGTVEDLIREAIQVHTSSPRLFGIRFFESLREIIQDDLEEYLKVGIALNILLDRLVYPSQKSSDPALEGWPPQKYFPDGFSFLSYNKDTDRSHTHPSGEKIRVDKQGLIDAIPQAEFLSFVKKLITLVQSLPKSDTGVPIINDIDNLKMIYQHISDFIQFAYTAKSTKESIKPLSTQSVLLNEYLKNPTEAVCRHKELLAQVLLQMFGLPGEVIDCHLYIRDGLRGNHLATLLRTEKSKYLIDFTNPDNDTNKTVFVERIKDDVEPDRDINTVMWSGRRNVGEAGGMQVMYLTRQRPAHVYYRILRDKR